jgi:hypothetical protein
MNFPFTPSAQYTAIALAYSNKEFVADSVLPRTPVSAREFKWDLHTKSDLFTVPSTMVGRKGAPNEVEFTATEQTSSVADYGLDDVVPIDDIEAAKGKPGLDPLGRAVEGIMELVGLDREQRVANLVFNAATYPTGSKETLVTADQWDNFASASSDPVEDIMRIREGMLMNPNKFVLGSQVWNVLRRHPKVIAAITPAGGNAATGGVAGLRAVADLLEFEEIIIGRAWRNTAAPGQAPVYARVWGKFAALLHQKPITNIRGNGISFGATAEYGNRVAGTIPEPKVGLRGAQRARAGESLKEIITAADCGYLISAPIV